MSITGTVPVKVPEKLSELELDAGGKRIDNLGLGDTPDDAMRRSEKATDYEVYGLLAAGLAADRPAPGIVDRFYFSTDTLILERDTGAAWVEVVRGEAAIRLAQLAEKEHSSLTGVGTSDHHVKYTDVEAQAQAAALIAIHAAIAAAHHTKTTDAAEIVSGTFPVARGGTGLSTIALGGILYASALDVLSRLAPTAANQVLRSTAANALQFAALLAADIPNLDASKITTGQIPLARLVDAVCSETEVGRLVDIYSIDYGLNWADLGVITTDFIECMAYLGDGIAILGGDDQHVHRSTDYGATWTDLGVITTDYIECMASLGNGIAILGGDDKHVHRSTDYGATWADLGVITTNWIYSMAYLGSGIAILGDADKHVWRSTDYGATWTDLGVNATHQIRGMAYLGNGIAILSDIAYHVWRSTDYGATWTDLGVIATNQINCMAYLGSGIAILGDSDYHVWRSTDYGATWADLGVITINAIYCMAYLGSGIAILGGVDKHVWRSTSAF